MNRLIFISIIILFFVSACSLDSGSSFDTNTDTGTGGSLASFTIVGNHLYTVDQSKLKVVNISNSADPVYKQTVDVGFGIETVFPRGNNLFIGSQVGMYIFDLQNAENPQRISYYQHIYSCDPVVADMKYAYVTLNTLSSRCGRNSNELQIVDISNLAQPKKVFSMLMSGPKGLSIKNDTLIVCDNGLKIYKLADDRNSISELYHFNMAASDVISLDNHILVIGEGGFYQYQIKNNKIELLSSILTE